MTIILHVPGASKEELARGIAAAEVAFASAGVQPWQGALSSYERAHWPDEIDQATDAERRAALAMDNARRAALKACCEGWPAIPLDARVDVVPIPF